MKSIKDMRNERLVLEFMGQAPAQEPAPVPGPAVAAPNGPAAAGPDAGDDIPGLMQRLLNNMKNKPVQKIIALQQMFNKACQQMLNDRSNSAGKRGLWQQYNQARSAKNNWSNQN